MTIMRGIADRDSRRIERLVAQAWWTANLDGAGSKLKPLRHYLEQVKPRKRRVSGSALEVFREHRARGAPIRIRHFGADGKELN